MPGWNTATVLEKISWNESLFSLRIKLDDSSGTGFVYKPGQFVRVALDIDGERVARPYSIVSTPAKGYLEVFFNIVPEGPLSPRLAVLEPGDHLFVADRASGFLTIDELPESDNLWLFATGTGVGPFISILNDAATWRRYRHVVLVYSVKQQSDLAYHDVIKQLQEEYPDMFVFVPVVTREVVEGSLHQRISQLISDGSLERFAGVGLTAEQSHAMMCGNSAMISDVSDLLMERGMKKHLRRDPGHFTTEKYH
jgi:ferredoxin--NADP+ reductase